MVDTVTDVQRKYCALLNSYVIQVGGVLFAAFVSDAFFGLKNASVDLCVELICQSHLTLTKKR